MSDMTAHALGEAIRQEGAVLADSIADVDEFVEALTPYTRPHRILTRGRSVRLNAHVRAIGSQNVSFTRVFYGADVNVDSLDVDPDNFMMPISLGGRGRIVYRGNQVPLGPSEASIIDPRSSPRSEIGHTFDQVIVALRASRVEALTGALLGEDGPVPPTLPKSGFRLGPAVYPLLEATARTAAKTHNSPGPDFLKRLDDLLIESILLSLPTIRDRHADTISLGSRHVSDAVDYMIDHLSEPLTLTEVAAHVGVTTRSLQAVFRSELDQSPMAWLRERRLHHARALVHSEQLPLSSHPVRDIAHASGFRHLGEFSAAFAAQFDELPSTMIRRVHAQSVSDRHVHGRGRTE